LRIFDAGALPGTYAVADGRGGWFVAGTGGVVRLRGGGRIDRAWRADLPRPLLPLWGLARSGGRLFATDRFRVIALDATSGARLWVSRRVDAGQYGYRYGIMALAPSPTAVFVGGQFARLGPARRTALAAVDARTGRVLSWRPPALRFPGAPAYVTALAVSGSRLYVGGVFDRVGRAARPGIAAVDFPTGHLLPFAPGSIDRVAAIVPSRRTVFIGGTFSGGAFDATTGRPRPWSSHVSGAGALALDRSTLFLGGDLRSSIGTHNLRALDPLTGKPRRWAPNLARYASVGTLAPSGGKVFVGGSFCSSVG
jgi:outer membrane protein assembly factor BamB